MSGHSHFATIKRQKEANDAAKGNVFSKMVKIITVAVKTGGGGDPDMNFKLRVAMDKARESNMPKENIERAIAKASSEAQNVEEVNYEGFAPGGVGVIVTVATDNRNRTSQEMKNIFERGGGSLGGPGSVSFNFVNTGFMLVAKNSDPDTQMLTLIDLGAEDVVDTEDGIEVYVSQDKLADTKAKIEQAGMSVSNVELMMKPVNLVTISDVNVAKKIIKLLDSFEEHDDVQKVYSNLDIPDEIAGQI